jgi:SsrA-binding protein
MKSLSTNKKAFHDYFILEEFISGIMLSGNEIKSLREGRVNLKDSYVLIKNNEAFILNMHVSEYSRSAKIETYEPTRSRKLLLHKKEISRLRGKVAERGLAIVPLEIFINNRGLAKLKIALVKGKKLFDKRASIKEKDIKRQTARDINY